MEEPARSSDRLVTLADLRDHLCQVRSSSRKIFRLDLRPPTGVRGSLGSTHTEQVESDKALRSSPMEHGSAEWA
ncbi:hypothetical protein EYF80_052617 [Liparis tanakae]|uniref:Uncharacterized protein n=1 Tax=Liparis tanakae TaxID=230148 RepID=A0A4Z2F8L9_9TELE|nr:hypothetical protein EYF80_052617 [Liparis tanakae]